jgi:hypothetical protein
MDGLVVLLDGRPAGDRVLVAEIRKRRLRNAHRLAEVLANLELRPTLKVASGDRMLRS